MPKIAGLTQKLLAKETIKSLIEKYQRLTPQEVRRYKEEGVKKDFILPLFRALGWSTDNGYEVSAEEDASKGRVDYAFRIEGVTKFYLEAKKFQENLDEPKFALQALNYAYHKSIPWIVLTDFEGLKIFNAEWDYKTDFRRSQYFELSHQEYLTKFDKLWLLSKESFATAFLDKDALEHGAKPKRLPVDQAIAADLTKWRGELTDQARIWNKEKLLSPKIIDESVQRLLDRLIFIRTAEDREIEDRVLLPAVHNWTLNDRKEGLLVSALRETFRKFDNQYNSELFKMHVVDGLDFEENDLSKIIEELYTSKQGINYDFQAIKADVLGRIYEQYLGYIQKTGGRKLGKNSKRKKQGIYYTPTYIVEYIVQNTLTKLLKEKSVREVNELKILDPACGSGSFLIRAFQIMDDWLKAEYAQSPDKNKDFARKVLVLTRNIYGVDLDPEAAEIARLNLLLQTLTGKARLPELNKNVKVGNSLISGTEGELKKYFGGDWKEKKPFDWQEQFPEVFKFGGFEVIIGNPPYVNIANIRDGGERDYLKENYKTAKNKSDLYSFFTERGIQLLKQGGVLGFIFSNSWLGTDSFSKFREYLVKNTTIYELVKLPSAVFQDATVTTVLIFLKKEIPKKSHKIILKEYRGGEMVEMSHKLSYERIKNSPNFSFSFSPEIKFKVPTVKLGETAKFSLGIKTSDDARFVSDRKVDENSYKLLRGKDVERYSYNYAGKWIWYKTRLMMEKVGAGPRRLEHFLKEKILFRNITGGKIIATLDRDKFLTNDKVNILYESDKYDLIFILGIVNSNLVGTWVRSTFGNLLEIKINQLQKIPIPVVEIKSKGYKEIIESVNKILLLSEKISKANEYSSEWEELKSAIKKTDRKIDEEVYKLYGLTPEEIKAENTADSRENTK